MFYLLGRQLSIYFLVCFNFFNYFDFGATFLLASVQYMNRLHESRTILANKVTKNKPNMTVHFHEKRFDKDFGLCVLHHSIEKLANRSFSSSKLWFYFAKKLWWKRSYCHFGCMSVQCN